MYNFIIKHLDIWLVSSIILSIGCGIIMVYLSSFLLKNKDFASLSSFQRSFTRKRVKSNLDRIDSKTAKIYLQQLWIDFGFMLGIFGLFLIISASVNSNIESSNLLIFLIPYSIEISILYLVFDFLEGVSSILILKNHICLQNENNNCTKLNLKFLVPSMTIFHYLKWLSVIIILCIGVNLFL